MDGVELVSRLRHNDRTNFTPIVVLTACVWPKERARAEGAGCDVFLPKPCLPNDLLDEVRQLIAAARSQAADTPRGARADEVFVMAKSTNRTKRSAASPALDPSSRKSAPLDRSANVTEYDIASRAYELYLARDCEDGHDVDDWLQAEQELQREREEPP